MLHLLKYSTLSKYRSFSTVFWPLVFPLILGTLFYFSFGRMTEADFETIPVAVVTTDESDVFVRFLEAIADSDDPLITTESLTETNALEALQNKEIAGIFYVSDTPTLTVGKNGLEESILQSLLETYLNQRQTLENIIEKYAGTDNISAAIRQMSDYSDSVRQVSLGGRTTNMNIQFFYALIGMACMYGSFIGLDAAFTLQANITALASRRSVTPTHKLMLIASEMLSAFIIHIINLTILLLYLRYVLRLDFQGQLGEMFIISFIGAMIGVCMGIFVGSIGKSAGGIKIGIVLGISMTCSFAAGLMNANMKNIVDRYVPLLNRINPAALISDAFYCINVYDDTSRYIRNLVTLSIMCVVLLLASFYLTRRERYDSL